MFPVEGQPADAVVSDEGRTLTVPGEGVYVLADDGSVTFTPEPGFTGTTTPVIYQIVDTNGTTDTAELTVTVQAGPAAEADVNSTPQNVTVVTDVLGNDTPGLNADGSSGTWLLDSVVFPIEGQPEGATVSDDGRTLTVPGEGVYTVVLDGDQAGQISFDPEPAFRGVATPVTYSVTDSLGNAATATLTITVEGIDPVVVPDVANTPFNTPVTLPGAINDTPGAATAPIVAEDTVFPADGQPEGAELSDDGTTLTVPGQGTWTVNPSGTITFTPEPGFVGPTTPITYQIVDTNGTTATGPATVTVRPGPVATPDSDTTPQNVDVTVVVLGNDTPGLNADGTLGTWIPTSVVFPTEGQPEGAIVDDGGKQLTVPGEGVYTAAENGEITFDPEPAFRGEAQPVTYTATDSLGNPASATLTITVDGIDPVATDDAASTPFNTPVNLSGLLNDAAGADSAPLVPALTVFPIEGQPAGAVVSDEGKTLTVEGEGVYAVNPDGSVTFTPADGFEGTTAPVTYQITDANGTTDTATLTVTVQDGPVAADDTAVTPQNVTVTIPVLTNDSPGLQADGEPGAWDASSVVFPTEGQPEGATVSDDGKALTVPGEGVYTIDADGVVTFDPEPTFRGETTPVLYAVTDSLGNPVQAAITVTVTPIDPIAVDDTANTAYLTPVTVAVGDNDAAGADTAPLVPGSTVFPTEGQPEGSELSDDGKTITVPGQGTWTVEENGDITFTPEPGFDGVTLPVTYEVRDSNGTPATATVTVTVRPGPVASADTATTPQNVNVTVDVIANDIPGQNADGSAGDLDPTSVVFPVEGQPAGAEVSEDGKQLTVPGVGVYTVDPETGVITFDPEPGFRGEAPAVTYAVTDSLGNTATAPLTITVTGIDPVATPDTGATPYLTPVTVPVIANDTPGADTAPLVPESVRFPVEGQPEGAELSEDGLTLTVPGQGVWTANPDGSVTFTPEPGFVGDTTPVTYEVSDANGTPVTSTVTVTVQPAPIANPDTGAGGQGLPVVIDPLGNDVAGPNADGTAGALDPTSVVFPAEGQPEGAEVSEDGKTLVVPGVGTYVIDPVTGAITFTPEPTFVGTTPPVTYEVTDSHGNPATSTVVVVIGAITPGATDDRATTPYNAPVTIDVLANDTAGSPEVPLDPTSLKLVDGSGALVDRLEVPGQGVWTVVDGRLVFTPADGFTGVTTPVTYSVADANGTRVTAVAVVEVLTTGAATDDKASTPGNTSVTVPVLENDFPGQGETLDPGTVCVVVPGTDNCVKQHTTDGVGTWVVNPDGTITFTPATGFSGDASITYRVSDTNGVVYSATLTISVAPVPPLPVTGTTVLGLLAGALVLLLGGRALMVTARRRRGDVSGMIA
ncbi:hypothetical protein C8046_09445 [Serinibacter arcticus]|uniref:CshA domain-containing protein n=1 Tax=Serinibacter arcticus TaxID=1655435 RepID=A0A2U1ZV66_9MICO|nr:tandem-95 repeat protein [Serinibacter arcticus]PWD50840.1 hypothetical protein C8046_09445 [Serinibacter arcticus]